MAKLFDEEGNEVEAFTPEELEAKTTEAKQSWEQELKEKVQVPEGKTLEEYAKEINDLAENSNVKQMREAIKNRDKIIANLKEQGKTLDDDGNIVDEQPRPLSDEELTKKTQEIVNKTTFETEKAKILRSIDEADREDFNRLVDKFMTGESQTIDKLEEAVKLAASVKYPERSNNILNKTINLNGGAPSLQFNPDNKEDFASTEKGKEIGKMMGFNWAKEETK